MPEPSGSLPVLIIVVGLLQGIYVTLIALVVSARVNSRIALLEFKVNELWSELTNKIEGT